MYYYFNTICLHYYTYLIYLFFFELQQLKYYTQIFVRSTKGRNAQGRKISGIEAMPGEDKVSSCYFIVILVNLDYIF